MKKWFCRILTLVMMLGLCAGAGAEEAPLYKLGDRIDDFSVTLSDGTEVSFYELLAQKKAVLLNFWASWCGPCRREFPFMQQAYDNYSKDIGILALSIEATDTDESILALREELGISSIPVGRETAGLKQRFGVNAYPTSVMVDRNGVICFMESGSVPDEASFNRLFDVFLAEDYAKPVLLASLPSEPVPEAQPADELRAALGVTQEQITVKNVEDDGIWPFHVSEDGASVRATNDALHIDTVAAFSVVVTVEAGQALAYDYTVTGNDFVDALWIQVDDKPVRMHSGAPDWSTGYVTFDSAGEHTVGIGFNRYRSTIGAVNAEACIAAVRVLSAEELAALKASEPVYPKVLEGTALRIETIDGELKQARVHTADNKIEQPIDVLRSNSFTHRICVGKDVDPSTVLIVYDGRYHLLSNLPCDTEGFLMRYDSTDPLNKELPPYHSLTLYANAFAPAESSKETVVWVGSENEMDSFVGFLTQFCQQVQHIDVELDWEYADGTPKQGAESIIAPSDGTGKYSFTVQDESGAPVAGVMLQICDDGTCAVAVTDANGAATHEAPAYPYEIHVLRVPEGYAAHAETYTMPAEGGSLVITLQKQ